MNKLKQKRKEIGITQIQAAKVCGVSRRTYQTYEETSVQNDTYGELLTMLNEIGIVDGSNYISNVRYIKHVCNELFKEKYPEIECAYLFGSYARGQATGKSDIDILLVCPSPKKCLNTIVAELEEKLYKKIDLHTHKELLKNEKFLDEILSNGIKIYRR